MSILPGKQAAIERMGSPEMYHEVAASFAATLPGSADAITKAIDLQHWEEARRLIHSLKGNCASLGADGLRQTVSALEKACAAGNAELVEKLITAVCQQLPRLREELLAHK